MLSRDDDHQPVLMHAVLLTLVELHRFPLLGRPHLSTLFKLSCSHFTFIKDLPSMEEEAKILFFPPRREVWSLVVVPAGKSPVTERGLEGGHMQGVYVYCSGAKNSTAASYTETQKHRITEW